MRGFVRRSGALLGVWLCGVALLAVFGGRAVDQLTHRDTAPVFVALQGQPADAAIPISKAVIIVKFMQANPIHQGFSWSALSTVVAAGLLLLLMAGLALVTRRDGLSGRHPLRLLLVAGLTAVAGGAAVALTHAIVDRGDASAALLFLPMGGAFLAVRAVAGRVAALHEELDGVI
jgi:hypothetical protein